LPIVFYLSRLNRQGHKVREGLESNENFAFFASFAVDPVAD